MKKKKKKRKWTRKKVKVVTESSALKRICELFIYPLVMLRPSYIGYREWVEELFCMDTRKIARYRALENFDMPGYYYKTPNVLAPLAGKRFIKTGMDIWARFDSTTPDRVDVEVTGRGRKAEVYKLTPVQWHYIYQFLTPNPFRSEKRCVGL